MQLLNGWLVVIMTARVCLINTQTPANGQTRWIDQSYYDKVSNSNKPEFTSIVLVVDSEI